jgi:hypothetical protein
MNKHKLDDGEESIAKYQKTKEVEYILPIDCILYIISYLDLKTTSLFRLTCKKMLNIIDDYLLSPLHNQTIYGLQSGFIHEKIDYVKAHKLKVINQLSDYEDFEHEVKMHLIGFYILPSYMLSSQELFDWLQPSHNFVIVSILNKRMVHRVDLLEKMLGFLKIHERSELNPEYLVDLFGHRGTTMIHKRIIDLFEIDYQRKFYFHLYTIRGAYDFISYYHEFNVEFPIPIEWIPHISRELLRYTDRVKKFEFLLNRKEYKDSDINIVTHLDDIDEAALETKAEVSLINLLIKYGKLKHEDFSALCIQHPRFMEMLLGVDNWNPTAICEDQNTDPIPHIIDPETEYDISDHCPVIIIEKLDQHPNWNPTPDILRRHIIAFKKPRYDGGYLEECITNPKSKYAKALTMYSNE